MMATLSELSGQLASDPDAQACVTDFLDYTQFFPSDLFRSMTLIGKFDDNYEQDTAKLHDLTETYGQLPSLSAEARPDARQLCADISTTLDHAVRCRESTYAEASRICTVAEHLYERLQSITRKLKALPQPPSRDPTPEPVAKSPKKKQVDRGRQSLFPDVRSSARATTTLKHRSRKIIVPGEVLPPFDPASEGAVSEDDTDLERASSPAAALEKFRDMTPRKIALPKILKVRKEPMEPKVPSEKKEKRPRVPGSMGTNVHSTVAGISVSNAMALVAAPPPDCKPGSKHAPWFKLTEWELNKLRKRMKKNADWIPSDTMVRRELSQTSRGLEYFIKAKKHAEATGEPLINEEPETFVRPLLYKKPSNNNLNDETSQELENRGMKLNQAKKLKRKALLEEQAALEQSIVESVRPSSAPVALMIAPPEDTSLAAVIDQPGNVSMTDNIAEAQLSKPSPAPKKRKRESSPAANSALAIDPLLLDLDLPQESESQPVTKKIKIAKGTAKRNKVAELEASVAPASLDDMIDPALQDLVVPDNPVSNTKPAPKSKASKPTSRASRGTAEISEGDPLSSPPTVAAIIPEAAIAGARSRVQRLSLTLATKAASAEPPAPNRRASERHVRRGSNASLPSTADNAADTAAAPRSGRSGKRAAPGLLTSIGDEGGAKVSLGKRRAAPGRKKSLTLKLKKDELVTEAEPEPLVIEDIDPNEERYCFCGDVSYGTMIACENDTCEKEWFHLA
jgi:hypothetical protein